jgi:hypothetical protein
MGREFIDSLGEHLRQDRRDLFPGKSDALRERIDHIRSKRISNITGSGRLVRSSADPGFSDVTKPCILELLEKAS